MTSPREVNDFHKNADKDASREALHHTLGLDPYQSSPGSHTHDGRDSKILSGLSVSEHTHLASEITSSAVAGLTSVQVQAALEELSSEINNPPPHGHNATATAFTPSGSLASANVQDAIEELNAEKSGTTHNHNATYSVLAHTHDPADLTGLPVAVSGDRSTGQALENLLTALDSAGIIIDNTVA